MAEAEVIAEFNDAAGLLAAVRQAREQRQISLAKLDELGGMPERFASKVLGPNPTNRLTMEMLHRFLFGLGVKCLLVHDPETTELIKDMSEKRRQDHVRTSGAHVFYPVKFLRERGRKGGLATRAKLSPQRRSYLASRAAKARWGQR
jgi:hypothetical protein